MAVSPDPSVQFNPEARVRVDQVGAERQPAIVVPVHESAFGEYCGGI